MPNLKSLEQLSQPPQENRLHAKGIRDIPQSDFFTQDERTILLAQKRGDTIEEMAVNLDLSIRTVKTIRKTLFEKLGVTTRKDALRLAEKNGILT